MERTMSREKSSWYEEMMTQGLMRYSATTERWPAVLRPGLAQLDQQPAHGHGHKQLRDLPEKQETDHTGSSLLSGDFAPPVFCVR